MTTKTIIEDFRNFQELQKSLAESGAISKEAATTAILEYAMNLILDLRITTPDDMEQENMYQGVNYN